MSDSDPKVKSVITRKKFTALLQTTNLGYLFLCKAEGIKGLTKLLHLLLTIYVLGFCLNAISAEFFGF